MNKNDNCGTRQNILSFVKLHHKPSVGQKLYFLEVLKDKHTNLGLLNERPLYVYVCT